jgi:hypothetical protein
MIFVFTRICMILALKIREFFRLMKMIFYHDSIVFSIEAKEHLKLDVITLKSINSRETADDDVNIFEEGWKNGDTFK